MFESPKNTLRRLKKQYPEGTPNRRILEIVIEELQKTRMIDATSFLDGVYGDSPQDPLVVEGRFNELAVLYPIALRIYERVAEAAFKENDPLRKEVFPVGNTYHEYEMRKKALHT